LRFLLLVRLLAFPARQEFCSIVAATIVFVRFAPCVRAGKLAGRCFLSRHRVAAFFHVAGSQVRIVALGNHLSVTLVSFEAGI
jgi:hypothetical protein